MKQSTVIHRIKSRRVSQQPQAVRKQIRVRKKGTEGYDTEAKGREARDQAAVVVMRGEERWWLGRQPATFTMIQDSASMSHATLERRRPRSTITGAAHVMQVWSPRISALSLIATSHAQQRLFVDIVRHRELNSATLRHTPDPGSGFELDRMRQRTTCYWNLKCSMQIIRSVVLGNITGVSSKSPASSSRDERAIYMQRHVSNFTTLFLLVAHAVGAIDSRCVHLSIRTEHRTSTTSPNWPR